MSNKKNYPDYHVCVETVNDDSENNLERVGAVWTQDNSEKVHASGQLNLGVIKTRIVLLENDKKED